MSHSMPIRKIVVVDWSDRKMKDMRSSPALPLAKQLGWRMPSNMHWMTASAGTSPLRPH